MRSKDWKEFSEQKALSFHFVFTVCNKAAKEPCPVWPGQPISAHWGFEDPAAFEGSETEQIQKFQEIFIQLQTRIGHFVNLPFASLDRLNLQKRLDEMEKPKEHSPNREFLKIYPKKIN